MLIKVCRNLQSKEAKATGTPLKNQRYMRFLQQKSHIKCLFLLWKKMLCYLAAISVFLSAIYMLSKLHMNSFVIPIWECIRESQAMKGTLISPFVYFLCGMHFHVHIYLSNDL